LFLTFVLTNVCDSTAQTGGSNEPWAGVCIAVEPTAGKVWKHEEKFTLPIPRLSTGVDVCVLKQTYGQHDWEQRRNYPVVGVGVNYTNFGIDSIYGQAVALYPCLEIPIIRNDKLALTLRVGDGIGYVTKVYQRTAPVDTINVAISNHVNDFAIVCANLRYRIDEHWDVQIGGHAQHLSNASYQKPNLGINMYGVRVGVRYFLVTSKPKYIHRELQPLCHRWLVQARLGMTMVSAYAPNGPLYPIYVASVYGSRRWHSKNKMFAGLDHSYHGDVYAYLRNNGLATGNETAQSSKSAVFAGNEFLFGRVGIMLQVGAYLKQAYFKKDALYQKVGANLYLVQKEKGPLKEMFLSVFLKTHQTVAEMGELGVGVGF
jgi:hypothetical protein